MDEVTLVNKLIDMTPTGAVGGRSLGINQSGEFSSCMFFVSVIVVCALSEASSAELVGERALVQNSPAD